MADVFPMDDVVLDGCDTINGHDNFSDDDCIEVCTDIKGFPKSQITVPMLTVSHVNKKKIFLY